MIFMVYVSHKREKVAIARKIKHASWKELAKKKKAQFEDMKDSIKADRVALMKKKEAVMYENPYGSGVFTFDLTFNSVHLLVDFWRILLLCFVIFKLYLTI